MSSGSLAFFGLFLFWSFLADFGFFLLTNRKNGAALFFCQDQPATLMLAMRNHLIPVTPTPSLILQFTAVSVSDGQVTNIKVNRHLL